MTDDRLTCLHPGCGITVLLDDGKFWNHSALITDEERAQARVKGGAASRNMLKARPEDLEKHLPAQSQQGALEAQMTAIAALKAQLERNPADTKAAIALSAASKRLSAQLTATDIERRLRELEEMLGKRKK